MKRILVGYASAHGSTKGIAKKIGERLAQAGFPVDVRPVDEVDTFAGYEAVVLGSAIHNQAWLSEAAAFVGHHAAALALKPVWLFSVSSVGDTSSFFGPKVARFIRRMRKETDEIAGFRQAIRFRGHRNFAGAIAPGHWGRIGGLFLTLFGGSYGDHRDWRDIDTWTDGIARELGATLGSALLD